MGLPALRVSQRRVWEAREVKLEIELLVDCIRCSVSVVVYSNQTEVVGNPLVGWTPTKTGWICPKHKEEA